MTHLCVLANSVKQTDISLVAGYYQFTRLGRGGSREIVLAGILLELTLDKLVAGYTGVNPEETVVRYSQLQSLMKTHNDR